MATRESAAITVSCLRLQMMEACLRHKRVITTFRNGGELLAEAAHIFEPGEWVAPPPGLGWPPVTLSAGRGA